MAKKSDFPKPVQEELHKCVFCKKPVVLLCGTPKILWGGCCVGVEYKNVKYMSARSAHVPCYLEAIKKNKKPKLFTRLKPR